MTTSSVPTLVQQVWIKTFAALSDTELSDQLSLTTNRGYASKDYTATLCREVLKRKYIKEATQDIDPDLGFSELLEVL